MSTESSLTVSGVAARLGVNQARVRAMIASGQLEARKVGGRWLLDQAAVDARLDLTVAAGRPLSTRSAWAVLWLATKPQPEPGSWDSYLKDRLVRWRARQRLGRGPVAEMLVGLAPRLRTRGRLHRARAHPSDVPRILDEPDVVWTGVSAAAAYAADIVALGVAEAYLPAARLPGLQQTYLLEPSSNPNVLIRAIDHIWPFPPGCRLAPPSAVALDLLDAGDERTRRAGRELLTRLEV